jgi:phosphocarrier protein FPr
MLASKSSGTPKLSGPGILVADNLTPFQASTLDRESVLGVVLLDGGPTAHSAILLRALGIPAVVQARPVLAETDLQRPTVLAFDGSTGKIWVNPSADCLAKLQDRRREEKERQEREFQASSLPAATVDGHGVGILANIGSASDVEAALRAGAEGVGLLRTEFLFLDRDSAPTEEEQTQALLAIAAKMDGKPLTIRTLDAGGDKALPYLKMPAEENPFLGVRALRLCFAQEDLFMTQLRAILRAGHGRDFRVMFPMVATATDLDRAKEYLQKVHSDLEKEMVPHLWPIPTGIMIEIPSAAIQAESLAVQADFFSIGTNDLAQYALAADRGNPSLASYQDALHPAILRLIEMIVNGAHKHDRRVAVCGEAASDEIAAALFVGLGVDELSMSSAKIPQLKASLRRQNLTELRQLNQIAFRCQTADEVRNIARQMLP